MKLSELQSLSESKDEYSVGDSVLTKVGNKWIPAKITQPKNLQGNYGVRFKVGSKVMNYLSSLDQLKKPEVKESREDASHDLKESKVQDWEVTFDVGPHQSETLMVSASSAEEAKSKALMQAKKIHRSPSGFSARPAKDAEKSKEYAAAKELEARLEKIIDRANEDLEMVETEFQRKHAKLVKDRAKMALKMLKANPRAVDAAWKYFQSGEK